MSDYLKRLADAFENASEGYDTPAAAELAAQQDALYLQRQQAAEVFERVMTDGAKQFDMDWLLLHLVLRDLVDAEYLPTDRWGETDPRIKALMAEVAFAVLSKYELRARKETP